MPTPTFDALANITLGANSSAVTFSSISQAYKDVILMAQVRLTESQWIRLSINGSTDFEMMDIWGDGGTAGSNFTTLGRISLRQVDGPVAVQLDFMDYSTTDKYKPTNVKMRQGTSLAQMGVLRHNTSSAITSISIFPGSGQWIAGSTFALYGIKA